MWVEDSKIIGIPIYNQVNGFEESFKYSSELLSQNF